MDMREQKLVVELKEANIELQHARIVLVDAKRKFADAESKVIDVKLFIEKLTEELRVVKVAQVRSGEQYDLYDDES